MLKRVSWEVLGRRLYETIFEAAPSLEPMFDRSALTMGIKMVDMIDSMVNNLDDMEACSVHARSTASPESPHARMRTPATLSCLEYVSLGP